MHNNEDCEYYDVPLAKMENWGWTHCDGCGEKVCLQYGEEE